MSASNECKISCRNIIYGDFEDELRSKEWAKYAYRKSGLWGAIELVAVFTTEKGYLIICLHKRDMVYRYAVYSFAMVDTNALENRECIGINFY